ncbi:agouti-related protein-like [Diretmus argenteus]
MFTSLLLCCWTCSLIRVSSALVHGGVQPEDGRTSPRRTELSFLSDVEKSHPSRAELALFSAESLEEQLMMDAESYDESPQDVAEALQLQGRAMRSPRRCTPHQQSCLGHALPCCDPCDTCYCRFFNAICYCRRVGQSCAHRRT